MVGSMVKKKEDELKDSYHRRVRVDRVTVNKLCRDTTLHVI